MKVHFHRMTTKYSNWLVNKIADKRLTWLLWENNFLETTEKDMRMTTMSLNGGTKMLKYLARMESTDNQRRKD